MPEILAPILAIFGGRFLRTVDCKDDEDETEAVFGSAQKIEEDLRDLDIEKEIENGCLGVHISDEDLVEDSNKDNKLAELVTKV